MNPAAKHYHQHLQKQGGKSRVDTRAAAAEDTGRYLSCFALMPYSFLGLFLCLHYVVHRLGHILLYVVNYVSLKRKKKTTTNGFNIRSKELKIKQLQYMI